MEKSLTTKINKFIFIMVIIITTIIILAIGFAYIGSELNCIPAIAFKGWLKTNFASLLGASGIAAFLNVYNSTVKLKTSNTEVTDKLNSTTNKVETASKTAVTAANVAVETSQKTSEEVKELKMQLMEALQNNAESQKTADAKQDIIFKTLSWFMYKNTNDQTIKDIYSMYSQENLLDALRQPLATVKTEITETKDKIQGTLKTASAEIKTNAKNVVNATKTSIKNITSSVAPIVKIIKG